MKRYPHVRVDIYEQTMYPVVSHIFYGKTLNEAKGYMAAHMETDSFLKGAVNKGYWRDLPLQVDIKEYTGD